MNEQEAKQKRIWETVADNWSSEAAEVEVWFEPITGAIRRALDEAGGTLADLGCGAGSLDYPKSWRVVGLDIAEDMVKAHGCAALGSFDPLPFQDDTFDAIVSRFGFIFAADVLAAFRESMRALKPGGLLVFSTWGPPDRNLWVGPPTKLGIEMLGLNMPKPTDPSAFRLADCDEVRELLTGAGFRQIGCEEVVVPYFERLPKRVALDRVLAFAGPVTMMHDRMDDAVRAQFERQVMDGFEASDLTGQAFVWSARKPS